jgi:hypothetical protein
MVGFSSGITSLLVSAVVGGLGLPFGVPPAPEDQTMGRVAPQNCLFYLSWAGTASPDPKNDNQTEQLLAEPEVQNFLKQVGVGMRAKILENVSASGADDEKAMRAIGKDALQLLEHLATRPGTVFVGGPKDIEKLRATLKKAKDAEHLPTKDAAKNTTDGKSPPSDDALLDQVKSFDAKLKERDAAKKQSPGNDDAKDAQAEKPILDDGSPAELLRLLETEFEGGVVLALAPDAAAWNARLKKDVETFSELAKDETYKLKIVSDGGNNWRCILPEKASFLPSDGKSPIRPAFGVHGDYLIIAPTERSYNNIVARMKQEPPQWWSNISKQLPIDRRSVTIYVDLRGWTDLYLSMAEMSADKAELHEVNVMLEMLGLSKTRAWIEVMGLDGHGFANKSLLLCDGEPQGLLQLISDQPLKPEDLAPIPNDAIAATAFRFDAQQAMDIILAAMEKMEPKQKVEALAAIEQAEKALGIDLRHGALKSLGDKWCIYSSPGEGYWPTVVVSLRDWAGMNIAYGRLMELGKQWAPASNKPQVDSSQPNQPRLEQFRFADNDVYCLNWGTCAPSWCLTKRELVFGIAPQTVKAYLTHDKRHEPLNRQPAITDLFAKNNGPAAIGYFDATPLFRGMYGLYGTICGPAITNVLRSADFETDLSLMPSAPAIYRHIGPSTTTLRRTKYGIECTSHGVLPIPSMTGYFAMAVVGSAASNMGILLPAYTPVAKEASAAVPAQPATATYAPSPLYQTTNNRPKDKPQGRKQPKGKHQLHGG